MENAPKVMILNGKLNNFSTGFTTRIKIVSTIPAVTIVSKPPAILTPGKIMGSSQSENE